MVKALCKLLAQKNRCGLPARTARKQLRCSQAGAGYQPAPLGCNSGAQRPEQGASPHRLAAILVPASLVTSFGVQRPVQTASPHRQQLWCSQAYQPAQLGNNFWKQPECSKARACCQFWCLRVGADRQHAPLRSKPAAQRPVRAASPLRLEAAQEQFSCSQASAGSGVGAASLLRLEATVRASSPLRSKTIFMLTSQCGRRARTAWKRHWCCQPAPLGSKFGAHSLVQAASPLRLETALLLKNRAGCSPHCSETTLVLKGRCGRPAGTARQQLWCSKVRAARPHSLDAILVLTARCVLPAGTAWKQLWRSKAGADCQPAAWKQLWCSNAAAGCQPALLGSNFGAQSGGNFGAQTLISRLKLAQISVCLKRKPVGPIP